MLVIRRGVAIACAIVAALPDEPDLNNPLRAQLCRLRVDRALRQINARQLRSWRQRVPEPEWEDRWRWARYAAATLYPGNPAVGHIPDHSDPLVELV